MALITQIPVLNNIQWVPCDVPLPTGAHSLPFYKQWFTESIRPWQTHSEYHQPIELGDMQFICLHNQEKTDVVLNILDEHGDTVQADIKPNAILFNANSYLEGNPDIHLIPHFWWFKPSEYITDEGTYYFHLHINFYNDADVKIGERDWISEPLDVKDEHPGTVLIKGWNNSNKHDVIFLYDDVVGYYDGSEIKAGYFFISPKFGFRIAGCRLDPETYTSSNVYQKEQDYEQRNLNSTGWSVDKLLVGAKGAPPYMMDKVNHYFSCDVVNVDDVRVVKNDGAEWAKEDASQYPMYEMSIEIRDYDSKEQITDRGTEKVKLIDDADEPFAIYDLVIKDANGELVKLLTATTIMDSTDRTNAIDYLNNVVAVDHQLGGAFSYSSGAWWYQNVSGENWTLDTDSTLIITIYTKYTVLTSGTNKTFGIDVFSGKCVLDWGDDVTRKISSTTTTVTATHTYATANTYDLYLFHTDSTLRITINNTSYTGVLKNIEGNLPQGLEEFHVLKANFGGISGGFDMGFLGRCRQNIKQIEFYWCGIDSLNGNVFNTYPATGIVGNSNNWLQLTYISLFYNNLGRVAIENFIDHFYDDTLHYNIAYLNLQQNPTVTLTTTSTINKVTNLRNAGCTVNILP